MIINAEEAILGRLSTKVAKMLLKGENVVVINSEKIVLSGNPRAIFNVYHEKRELGDANKGPFYPRYPDRVFRRAVRGMLPYRKSKGRDALRRLKVFIGNPDNLKGEKISKTSDDLKCKYVYLGEVCKRLGAKLG
jgi:large subunit ribosomal protein L13